MSRLTKGLLWLGAFVALAVGGSAIAGAASSNGTPTTTSTIPSATDTTASSSTSSATDVDSGIPDHGTASHEDAETTVTGDAATKAQAAAVKAVGSGTAGQVTSDFTGSGYEVTVTETDGSTVIRCAKEYGQPANGCRPHEAG